MKSHKVTDDTLYVYPYKSSLIEICALYQEQKLQKKLEQKKKAEQQKLEAELKAARLIEQEEAELKRQQEIEEQEAIEQAIEERAATAAASQHNGTFVLDNQPQIGKSEYDETCLLLLQNLEYELALTKFS